MLIEVIAKTWYTVELTDEDMGKVKQYIRDHKDELSNYDMEENILQAVRELHSNCEIELYNGEKETESDFQTYKINWSEFEGRSAEEILGEDAL